MNLKKNKDDNSAHGLLFHYNPYTEKWACFSKKDKADYFNGENRSKIGYGNCPMGAYVNNQSKNK